MGGGQQLWPKTATILQNQIYVGIIVGRQCGKRNYFFGSASIPPRSPSSSLLLIKFRASDIYTLYIYYILYNILYNKYIYIYIYILYML